MKGEGYLRNSFKKNGYRQNAYLWHNSAQQGAQKYPLRSNDTEREVYLSLPRFYLSLPQTSDALREISSAAMG